MKTGHPIIVVNKRTAAVQPGDYYVGRPAPLGNPFVIGRDGDRAEVIGRYRQWLQHKLTTEPDSAAARDLHHLVALAQRGPLRLVCWCAPLPCHGDVLVALIGDLLRDLEPSR